MVRNVLQMLIFCAEYMFEIFFVLYRNQHLSIKADLMNILFCGLIT